MINEAELSRTTRRLKNCKKIDIKEIIKNHNLYESSDNNNISLIFLCFRKIKSIILFLLLLSIIIDLIIFFILYNSKSNKKVSESFKLNKKILNKDGFYIPKDISSDLLYKKCSVENCKKCYGNSYYDICTSCFDSYNPIFDKNNKSILSCVKNIPKPELSTDIIRDIQNDIISDIKTDIKTTLVTDIKTIKTDIIKEKLQTYIIHENSNSSKELIQNTNLKIDYTNRETILDTIEKTTELLIEETTDIISKTTITMSTEVKNFDFPTEINTELNQETSYIDITTENIIIECEPGYYLPDGINTGKKCKQCSLGCEKCHGDNIINYCDSCFSNYIPRYINNNLLCNIEIEKNCNEYQILNEKFNCLKCDNEYVLYDGKCLSYSFVAVYNTTSNNQNLQLLSLDTNYIETVILDQKKVEPKNNYLISENGYHTAYFFLRNNLTSLKNLFSLPSYILISVNFTSHMNTKNITDLSGIFKNCRKLISVELSNFDTSNVEDMSYMFCECYELKSINLQNFNTSKVKYMNRMFWCNHLLKIIDIGNFDIKNVINFEYIFFH